VQADKMQPGGQARRPPRDADIRALEHELSARLGLKVTVKTAGKGGTLSIAYRSLNQLEAVLARLRDGGRTAAREPVDGASAEIP
jgi:ParB family transcriptional regulator, chromosome partitioning protein